MKYFNKNTGRLAEKLATDELQKKGYQILENNFSNRYGEIDIIAKDKETTVFVEVKAKKGLQFGLPEEMINKNKLQKIQRMAQIYLKGKPTICRIDVVAIILSPTNDIVSLNHYKNVSI